jgi:hypothetical protein|tara:strand:+ start:192 stop:737 length:546 start_codon:yes stop_codon:yes gene_type:complete
MANYKSGMKMQMGSKQKNTPSNFSGSAFKMITGGDPISDLFKNIDPVNSLGQDQMENMNEAYNEMNAGYQPPVQLVSKNTGGGDHEAYASLGAGLKNLLKPKAPEPGEMGSQAYYSQQERKADRKVKRFERGKVNVPSTTKDKDGNIIPNAYDNALANQKKFKNKKGTQTKVGAKLRKIFK